MQTIPIPSLFWQSLEASLQAKTRHLAKEIASTLSQSEAPLLQELKSKSVKAYLWKDTDTDPDMRCDYLCQRPSAPKILQKCGEPILWSANCVSKRCPRHQGCAAQTVPVHLPLIHPLPHESEEPFFYDDAGNLYDQDYTIRGRYNKETRQVLYWKNEEENEEAS